ncbi:MAG: alpha/beta fold hydrolase, partial [Trebonia sp.]
GFGASSRPSIGYDFDTLAGDLDVLLSALDLHGVVLAGFAMGTGEVTRHLAVHGSARVRGAVLIAPLLPFLLKTTDAAQWSSRRCIPFPIGLSAARADELRAILPSWSCGFDSRHPLFWNLAGQP